MYNSGGYEDIINLPHHVSSKRPQMPMLDRAAQFSPFAALTGYDDAIHETGRLTDQKINLSEEEKEALDRKQQILMERLGDHPALIVTYFVPDAKKSGGAYVTKSGNLKKIDEFERLMMLMDGTKIPLDNVADSRANCSAICFECRFPCDQTEDDFSYTVTVSKSSHSFSIWEDSS